MNRSHFGAALLLSSMLLGGSGTLSADEPAFAAAVLASSHPPVLAPPLAVATPQVTPVQLAIVIDDLGYNWRRDQQAIALPAALTVAVLPQAPRASKMAQLALGAGKEVILHQPMQTLSGRHQHEHGNLRLGMSEPDYAAILSENLSAVPGSVGINNHRGSLLTAQLEPMSQLMAQLRLRGLYFLDSRTTADTVAHQVAKQWGIPTLKRDVFLDHERTPAALDRQFARALHIARRQGYAVLIAHPHQISLDYLNQAIADLPGDVETVTLSQLIARQ